MLTLLTVASAVAGLLLLPTYPWVGILLLAAAYAMHRRATFDEGAFIGTLAILAAAGALAMTAEGLWIEFIALR